MSQFYLCPRCGERGLERLSTHAFCVNCNYDEVRSEDFCGVPQWAIDALKNAKPRSIVRELRIKEKEHAFESAV